jgi:beta-lactamase superfamily II metal-dependent hydrolase
VKKLNNVNITILNVGHGDSIVLELITTTKTYCIVIDCNIFLNKKVYYPTSSFLKKRNIYNIDYLILTHPHRDHYSGLEVLLKDFSVQKIIVPEILNPNIKESLPFIVDFKQALEYELYNRNSEFLKMRLNSLNFFFKYLINNSQNVFSNKIINLFKNKFYDFKCFTYAPHINTGLIKSERKKTILNASILNDLSIITFIECFNFTILLTGDLPANRIIKFINKYVKSVDIIKLSHHGNREGTSNELLRKLLRLNKNVYMVVSSDGKNMSSIIKSIDSNV